ncbi:MAG: hypothetical protein H7A55_00895 [Verrucomicrobiaceae bacterium]|nr:hypothetical protein [Verrucomicrobiaceae bacterium]
MNLKPILLRRSLLTSACAAVLAFVGPAVATVDDAHSFAMEAAQSFVDQGFIVREDYWNGEVKSGQKLMVRHQLFKGNEYAFWLGTANDGVDLELKIYDEKGKSIEMDRKVDKNSMFVSVRVNPPKTGTYTLVFSLKSHSEKSVFWALAYGYR